MISRLLKIIGLFCKRALSKRPYSAKETYNFKEPTNRSQPIQCTAHFPCFRNHISAKDPHISANDKTSDTGVKQQECAVHCTRRRRLKGYLKLQVIFRKRATDYRALLQKIICRDNASYGTKPPCTGVQKQECAVHGKSWAMCHVSRVRTHRVRL